MSNRPTLGDLTPAQAQALTQFAAQHGRSWRRTLNDAWTTGRDAAMPNGGLLRQIRNQQGPTWLARLTLKGASTQQMKM